MIIFQHNKLDKWRRGDKDEKKIPFLYSSILLIYKRCVHLWRYIKVLSHILLLTWQERKMPRRKSLFSTVFHIFFSFLSVIYQLRENTCIILHIHTHSFIHSHNNNHFFSVYLLFHNISDASFMSVYNIMVMIIIKQLPINLLALLIQILFFY